MQMRGFILERFGCHINRDDIVFLKVKSIIAEVNLIVKSIIAEDNCSKKEYFLTFKLTMMNIASLFKHLFADCGMFWIQFLTCRPRHCCCSFSSFSDCI